MWAIYSTSKHMASSRASSGVTARSRTIWAAGRGLGGYTVRRLALRVQFRYMCQCCPEYCIDRRGYSGGREKQTEALQCRVWEVGRCGRWILHGGGRAVREGAQPRKIGAGTRAILLHDVLGSYLSGNTVLIETPELVFCLFASPTYKHRFQWLPSFS